MSQAIYWFYRYHRLDFEALPNFAEAVLSAEWDAREESASFVSIECDGKTYGMFSPEYQAVVDKDKEESEAYTMEPLPKPTVVLEVQSPDGIWVVYTSYVHESSAQDDSDDLTSVVGESRVRLRKI